MNEGYSLREVGQILGLSRSIIMSLIEAGFVVPTRGKRRELRFTFEELVVMRAARVLRDAKLPPRRVSQSLKRLRSMLPREIPVSGLRIEAIGDAVIVNEGGARWSPDTGQYLLSFQVVESEGKPAFLERNTKVERDERNPPPVDHEGWFSKGWELEQTNLEEACAAYRHALEANDKHAPTYANLGRLLHQAGRLDEAEAIYRQGVQSCSDVATLFFNLAVLLEDRQQSNKAMALYETALKADPGYADAHYNLALLYEQAGQQREALRHFNAYRKLAG